MPCGYHTAFNWARVVNWMFSIGPVRGFAYILGLVRCLASIWSNRVSLFTQLATTMLKCVSFCMKAVSHYWFLVFTSETIIFAYESEELHCIGNVSFSAIKWQQTNFHIIFHLSQLSFNWRIVLELDCHQITDFNEISFNLCTLIRRWVTRWILNLIAIRV